ncbi:MAG: hypothetical protein HGGPFJEG_02408 [Ignavibacteria bacterium]|nr:hypothetical protein [Ignavibacteria bacterium]
MITLIAYILIKGNITGDHFKFVVKDPIIYLIMLFIIFYLILLLMNAIRAREIIIDDRKLIFKNRFGQREVMLNEVIRVKFSREKRIPRQERSDVRIVKLKLKGRKRFLRIRLNDFQNEKGLIIEFRKISKNLSTAT